MSQVVRVAVTGAAGQVAYAMLARIAAGEVFGKDKKVILQLLEIPQTMQALEGVVMELEDLGSPNLEGIVFTDDANKAFAGVNWALPRRCVPPQTGYGTQRPAVNKRQDFRQSGPGDFQECRQGCAYRCRGQSL